VNVKFARKTNSTIVNPYGYDIRLIDNLNTKMIITLTIIIVMQLGIHTIYIHLLIYITKLLIVFYVSCVMPLYSSHWLGTLDFCLW
jgi:hypothetical protein